MKTSGKGRAAIAALEGVVTRAYRCPAGIWTIGVGHTAAAGPPEVREGMTISRAEAEAILERDLARFEARVAAALGDVPQHVFDGAVSFDFNCGAIERASWVKALLAGDRAGAEASLKRWVKAGGRTLAGLVRRRAIEADMIFRGIYPDAATDPRDMIMADQKALARLGFHAGPIDGIAGPATKAAVRAFQARTGGLVVDGVLGPATRAALARALKARDAAATASAGAAAATAGAAIAVHGGGWIGFALVAAGLAVLAVAAAVGWRHRIEIGNWFRKIGETL